MKRITKLAPKIAYIVTLFTIMAAMGFTGLYLAVGPGLPDVDTIRQIRLQTPMSVYSKDGQLINEFGDIRRVPITLDQVPQDFINALLATEDVRFYQHSGVDFLGVARAVLKLVSTGTKSQGASTITMLVARNYYLTREKRFSRKFTEMFVSWILEAELSKTEILELFLNKIPFGHRAAGLGAAAQVYYGKTLKQLSLPQLATLAGIPNGPSIFNPISKPQLAKKRRQHVLGRMLAEGHINQDQYDTANLQPIKTTRHGAEITVSAPYISEMVHMDMIRRFGREITHNDGLKIYTSIDPKLQKYAQDSLRTGLFEYDKRHGYRPVEQHYDMQELVDPTEMIARISDFQQIGSLIPALVVNTTTTQAEILLADGSHGLVLLQDSLWAKKYVDENYREFKKLTDINQIVLPGDVIRVQTTNKFELIDQLAAKPELTSESENTVNNNSEAKTLALSDEDQNPTPVTRAIFELSQLPDASAGFVVLNPQDGAVEALVGGFDYANNKYNMVTQARRQIGSNIKPFIYSAALNQNYTAASIINDSPIINWDSSADVFWRPENDSGNYRGPMRLRHALRWSVNTVSIRLMGKIGARYAKSYLEDIGFPGKHMKPYLSLALGSASFTPMEVVAGYSVLANGGYQIVPWYISRIENSHGQILFEQQPVQVCEKCLSILDADEAMKLKLALELETASLKTVIKDNEKLIEREIVITDQIRLERVISDQTHLQDSPDGVKTPLNWLYEENQSLTAEPYLPVAENKIAPRVIDARNRYIIDSILKDVIHRGTAWRTLSNAKSPLLKRSDLAGKTGTTNESKDAWFSGYNVRYVASAWVGFEDHSKKLGNKEFGARAALPIWRRFMEQALSGTRQENLPRPEGIVDVKIDLSNGKLASASTDKADFEVFRIENIPTEYSEETRENSIEQLDEQLLMPVDEESIPNEVDNESDQEIDFG